MAVLFGGCLLVSGCEVPGDFASAVTPSQKPKQTTVTVIEQEVEAPEVFFTEEPGLWDGRPSLGGIWVAHPDTIDPEQVIVRNTTNGKFVVGSLFIRERALPGPRLQVSSDAAIALDMLAGQPVELSVTALRKREVELAPATTDVAAPSVEDIATTAIETAAEGPGSLAPQLRPTDEITIPAKSDIQITQTSNLEKPYIQLGIFGVAANANNTEASLRAAGIVPTIKPYQAQGKTFWRVLVGPAANASERKALLTKVREQGFTDAYFVTD